MFDIKKLTEKMGKDKSSKLLILVLVGVLLLIIVWPTGTGSSGDAAADTGQETALETNRTVTDDSLNAYVARQEERLCEIVRAIDGAGAVSVMITAKSTRELVVEKDRNTSTSSIDESDSAGGTRNSNDQTYNESTIYSDTTGNGVPYVVKELEPEIEGIVVVAEGGDNLEVVNEITEAIAVLFNVPVHKIKVVKMNTN